MTFHPSRRSAQVTLLASAGGLLLLGLVSVGTGLLSMFGSVAAHTPGPEASVPPIDVWQLIFGLGFCLFGLLQLLTAQAQMAGSGRMRGLLLGLIGLIVSLAWIGVSGSVAVERLLMTGGYAIVTVGCLLALRADRRPAGWLR